MFGNFFFPPASCSWFLKIRGYRFHYKISRWIFARLPSLKEKKKKKNQSDRFNPVCNRIFGKQFELCRMGRMYFMECNENESLLGGMCGSYIRYSKVEPHWSAFWSNYIDIWSLKKFIACSLWIFSKTFFLKPKQFFSSSFSHKGKDFPEVQLIIV